MYLLLGTYLPIYLFMYLLSNTYIPTYCLSTYLRIGTYLLPTYYYHFVHFSITYQARYLLGYWVGSKLLSKYLGT
jgi:hypothetical protein